MIVFIVNRIGPYHHDRFLELIGKVEFTVVQICKLDSTYKWDVLGETDRYKVVTLFNDENFTRLDLIRKLFSALDTQGSSTVFIPGWSQFYSLVALFYCQFSSRQAILMSDSTHEDRQRSFHKEIFKSVLLKFYDKALVAGTKQERYLISLRFKGKIEQGYDVIDSSFFNQGYDATSRRITFVGRFVWEKNLTRLLQAYKSYLTQVNNPYELHLIGDGPCHSDLVKTVRKLDLERYVTLHGFMQRQAIKEKLGESAALILPSVSETWGLAVNEAIASGLPVLVSNKCGCSDDLVLDNGLKFDPNDVPNITQALVLFHSLPVAQRVLFSQKSYLLANEWNVSKFSRAVLRLIC